MLQFLGFLVIVLGVMGAGAWCIEKLIDWAYRNETKLIAKVILGIASVGALLISAAVIISLVTGVVTSCTSKNSNFGKGDCRVVYDKSGPYLDCN